MQSACSSPRGPCIRTPGSPYASALLAGENIIKKILLKALADTRLGYMMKVPQRSIQKQNLDGKELPNGKERKLLHPLHQGVHARVERKSHQPAEPDRRENPRYLQDSGVKYVLSPYSCAEHDGDEHLQLKFPLTRCSRRMSLWYYPVRIFWRTV